jgi:uncharacterized membrane protein YkoI
MWRAVPQIAPGPPQEEATMKTRSKAIVGALAGVAVIGIGTGIGVATMGDDDRPLTGSDLEQATAVALEHTGGGTVTESEIGDDGAAYSVEVRLADGSQVEVNLNANFEVIGSTADDDGAGDGQESGDTEESGG